MNSTEKQIFIYLLCLSFSFSQSNAQDIANKEIDSLLIVLEKVNDTTKINTLNSISRQYIGIGAYDKALKYTSEAQVLALKLNFSKGVAASFNNIGIINSNTGNYEVAVNNYLKALKINESINDRLGVANAYSNIGIIYMVQKNYDKALENSFKALAIKEKDGDIKGSVISYNNIGLIYYNQGKYEKALENYFKCLEILKETNDKYAMSVCYNNIGNVYKLQKKYAKALENQMKGLEISKEVSDTQGIAYSYFNIGSLYMLVGQFDESETYLKKAINIDNEIGNKDAVKEEYLSLAQLFEKKGDFKEAFDYHKKYADAKDSLLNETSAKQITEMNTKYESEKKEKDIELLTKDKALQQSEIGGQKLIRNSFVVGLILAMVLAFVLFNRFNVTRKQKHIIESQNEQIVESINYSKRIQDALLPSIESMQKCLPGMFVFYQPKNIVSGDFYFFKEFKNYILLACVDCTGHGVPGGFMSTLGSLLLDKVANDERMVPSEILTQLNDEIIRILHQRAEGELQDGMDLSVCLIDRNNRKIEFCGARNGIIVVTNNVAKRYKASPLPVGGNYMKKGMPINRNFQTQSIELNISDWVYMYTDGFIEQLGGSESAPMNYEQFENKLISLSQKYTADEKVSLLQTELTHWRGANDITDDILIMGFQI